MRSRKEVNWEKMTDFEDGEVRRRVRRWVRRAVIFAEEGVLRRRREMRLLLLEEEVGVGVA